MIKNVGIVGGGKLGTAINQILDEKVEIEVYSRSGLSTVDSVADLCVDSDVVLLAIPSWSVSEVSEAINSCGFTGPVVSMSKGLVDDCKSVYEVMVSAGISSDKAGLIYGPMLSAELSDELFGSGLLALEDQDLAESIKELFQETNLRLDISGDPKTVALLGPLKNMYALIFGVCDGLALGHNAKGWLGSYAIEEMQEVLTSLNLDPSIATSTAGLGDMLATGWSGMSFNYRIGKSIGRHGHPQDTKGEGFNSLKLLDKSCDISDWPLLDTCKKIVIDEQEPELLKEFIYR